MITLTWSQLAVLVLLGLAATAVLAWIRTRVTTRSVTVAAFQVTRGWLEEAFTDGYEQGAASVNAGTRGSAGPEPTTIVDTTGSEVVIRDDIPLTSLALPDLMALDVFNGSTPEEAYMRLPSGLVVSVARLREMCRERAAG